MATACRSINIVEDERLLNVIHVTSNDCSRHRKQQHNLYEDEEVEVVLGQTDTVALTGDDWTSLSNHMTSGVTAHYFGLQWELRSRALTVIKVDKGRCAHLLLGLSVMLCFQHIL